MKSVIALMAAAVAIGSYASADEFLLQSYEEKYNKYIENLDQLNFIIFEHHPLMKGGGAIVVESEVIVARGHLKATCVEYETGGQESPAGKRKRCIILRPDGYFEVLFKNDRGSILRTRRADVTTLPQAAVLDANSPINTLLAPVALNRYPVLSILNGLVPRWHATLADFRVNDQGMSYRARLTANGDLGHVSTSCNSAWLVTSSTTSGSKDDRTINKNIEYITYSGRILPNIMHSQAVDADGSKLAPSRVEFRSYQLYSFNNADFSLAQFGLPEAVGYVGPRATTPIWLFLLAAGGVLAVLSVLLRRRLQRG